MLDIVSYTRYLVAVSAGYRIEYFGIRISNYRMFETSYRTYRAFHPPASTRLQFVQYYEKNRMDLSTSYSVDSSAYGIALYVEYRLEVIYRTSYTYRISLFIEIMEYQILSGGYRVWYRISLTTLWNIEQRLYIIEHRIECR